MKGADEMNDATAELHHGWGHDPPSSSERAVELGLGETCRRLAQAFIGLAKLAYLAFKSLDPVPFPLVCRASAWIPVGLL